MSVFSLESTRVCTLDSVALSSSEARAQVIGKEQADLGYIDARNYQAYMGEVSVLISYKSHFKSEFDISRLHFLQSCRIAPHLCHIIRIPQNKE